MIKMMTDRVSSCYYIYLYISLCRSVDSRSGISPPLICEDTNKHVHTLSLAIVFIIYYSMYRSWYWFELNACVSFNAPVVNP